MEAGLATKDEQLRQLNQEGFRSSNPDPGLKHRTFLKLTSAYLVKDSLPVLTQTQLC